MFYFYHIAHMAKHFINGGCGIRSFVDLWLIENHKNYHTTETEALLKKGCLSEFAARANELCKVWFSQKEHSETTRLMEEYILNGGTFGSEKTKTAVNKKQGEAKFVLSKLFAPSDYFKRRYPFLKKCKFLLPFFQLVRVFSFVFGKKRKIRKKYITEIRKLPDGEADRVRTLFENLEL